MHEVVYKNNNRAWLYCWKHQDSKRPNLAVTLSEKYYGRFKCFACGYSGTFTSRQMAKLGLDRMKSNKPVPINWNQLVYAYRSCFVTGDTIAEIWNVDPSVPLDFGMGWDEEAYTFPMYNENNEVIGIQRRWKDGGKACVSGSKLGLFIPVDYAGCDNEYLDYLFITEGVSDACAVYDLGLYAIGRPSCNSCAGMVREFIRLNKNIHTVIVIPDNDKVGINGAKELQQEIDNIAAIQNFRFQYTGVKDIREYIAKEGKEKVREELEKYL